MSLFQAASGWAVRHLPQKRIMQLRNTYSASKRAMGPLLLKVYGTFDTNDLKRHLEEKIGRDFDILMVHSSVNHMQPYFSGSPLELVRMLIDYCGPERTLAMPAFYFGDPSVGGAYPTFKQNPRFDIRRTPSQMGLVTELFRRSRGVLQSRHPVNRISALGPLAEALTTGHELAATAAGRGTPFDTMAQYDTLILGIGKPMEVITQVHHAEDVLGEDFPVPRRAANEPVAMTLVDGSIEIPFTLSGSDFLWQRDMWRLRKLMDKSSLREWRFHHVPIFATRASAVSKAIFDGAARGVTIYKER